MCLIPILALCVLFKCVLYISTSFWVLVGQNPFLSISRHCFLIFWVSSAFELHSPYNHTLKPYPYPHPQTLTMSIMHVWNMLYKLFHSVLNQIISRWMTAQTCIQSRNLSYFWLLAICDVIITSRGRYFCRFWSKH